MRRLLARGHALSSIALLGQVAALAAQFAVARRLGADSVVDGWVAAQNIPALAAALLVAVAGQLAMPELAKLRETGGECAFKEGLAGLARRFALLGCAIGAVALFPAWMIDAFTPGLSASARHEAIRLLPPLALGAAPAGLVAALIQSAALRGRHLLCASFSPLAAAASLVCFLTAPPDDALPAMVWAQTVATFLTLPWCFRLAGLSLRDMFSLRSKTALGLVGVVPVLLIAGSARVNLTVDAFFAASLHSGELALFGYATRGVALLQAVLVAPVSGLVFASLSQAAARGAWRQFADETRRATLAGFALSVPAALLVALLGFDLATFLLGPEEADAARMTVTHCLWALSGIVVFGVWGSILARACIASGNLGAAVWFLGIIPIALNAVLDAWLAPRFGVAGLAAVTSLNAVIGLPILHIWLARQGVTRGPLLAPLLIYLACAGAAGLAATGVAGTVPSPKPTDPALYGLWIGLLAAVAAAVYFALVRRVAASATTQ